MQGERMKTYSDVVIVGAGASGLLCGALVAKQGKSVVILEKNGRLGRKLLATGNGRCNFTNKYMESGCYYGKEDWIQAVLEKVTPEDVIRCFTSFGVLHRERDGYVYPHTNQAITVVNGLHRFCQQTGVVIELDCNVQHIRKRENKNFEIVTNKGKIVSKELVLATGGIAGKESGGTADGYVLAKELGHKISNCYPGLTGLISNGKIWKKVAGTRIQGTFSIMIDGKKQEGESGEIQIVKNGVSGIPVFQLCRVAAKAIAEGKKVEGLIDFVPSMTEEELAEWIALHGKEGVVPAKWLPVLQNSTAKQIKAYRFGIEDTFGMGRAQVTAGGVPLEEVEADTMESKKMRHLYLTGELLHVDGKCGGYNLHFAWSSAILAAAAITKR